MNEVRLSGWFATEGALSEREGEEQTASFIIRVPSSLEKENFFRVVCIDEAARMVREAALSQLLLGTPVEVVGSLAQGILEEGEGHSSKVIRVVAKTVEVGSLTGKDC